MKPNLSFTITAIEPRGAELHVGVLWTANTKAGERISLLFDTLVLGAEATKDDIEKAVRQRATSFVQPHYLDPKPAQKPEHLALVGVERLVSELEEKV